MEFVLKGGNLQRLSEQGSFVSACLIGFTMAYAKQRKPRTEKR